MGDFAAAVCPAKRSLRPLNMQAERLPLGRRDPPLAASLARCRRQGAHLHQRALRGAQAQARRRGGRRRQPDQVVLVSLRGARATPKLHAASVVREPYCSAPLLGEFVCARVRVTSCACGACCVYARPGTGAPEAWPWAWRVETFVWLRLGTVSASRPCPSCGHCESRVSQSTASFIALSPAGLRSLLYRASLSLPPRSAAPVAAPGSLARAATRAKPRARGVRAGAAEHRSEERVHQINTHVPAQPPAPPCPSPLRSRLARRGPQLSPLTFFQ